LELRHVAGAVVPALFIITWAPPDRQSWAALEAIEPLLDDPEICTRHVRSPMQGVNTFEAVGEAQAPRRHHCFPTTTASMPMA